MSVPSYKTPQRVRNYGQGSQNSNSSVAHTPFIQNPHAHPQFQPTRLLAKVTPDLKGNLKQPKAPDKPLMPYMRYSRKVWDSVKAKHQEMKLWEIGKIIGGMWREQSANEKAVFGSEYEIEKVQYSEQLKAYHNSAAYQEWIANKGRQDNEHGDDLDKRSKNQEHARVSIQPADEDDEFDSEINTAKHLASARFQRNHQLINDILSNVLVPDVRMVVTSQRMVVLERQVDSLKQHQKKLEKELEDIDERHKLKKRKLQDSSAAFNKNLEKVISEKAEMTSEQVEELLQKTKEELRARHLIILEEEKQKKIEAEKEKIKQQKLLELKIEEDKIAQEKAIKEEEDRIAKEKQAEIDLKEKEDKKKEEDDQSMGIDDKTKEDEEDKKEEEKKDVKSDAEKDAEGDSEKNDLKEVKNVEDSTKIDVKSSEEKTGVEKDDDDVADIDEAGEKEIKKAEKVKTDKDEEVKKVEDCDSEKMDVDQEDASLSDKDEKVELTKKSDDDGNVAIDKDVKDCKPIDQTEKSPKSDCSPAIESTNFPMEVDINEKEPAKPQTSDIAEKSPSVKSPAQVCSEDGDEDKKIEDNNAKSKEPVAKEQEEDDDDKEDYGEDTDPEDIPEDMEVEELEENK